MTNSRGPIPILIPAANQKDADGMTFMDGKPVYGRVLRESILDVFEVEHARQVFEKRYGQLADSQWAGIKAAIALIQAMQKQDPRHLQDYIKFQAFAEIGAEEELVKELLNVFKSPEAQKKLTPMLETVRGLKKRTWSEESAKLTDRTAAGGGFAVVSELLWQLNRMVRKAQFVMYFDRSQRKPLPAIYCPDAGTGLAAMIFNRVPTPRGLGVCRRPACQKSFLRVRPGQQYCSLRCGNADRKAQERARKSQR